MAKAKSIEENFEKLEEIIDNLEQNDMSLEEAFKAYEAGIRPTAQCAKQLDNVEKQIIVLREESAASNGDED